MENILVAGANGTTGKQIVQILKQDPYFNPVAMVRKRDQMEQFEEEEIDVVLADLEKDVSHAMEKIDKVIFAAGSGGENVIGVDQEGAKRLIDASKNAEVKKFVMLSSMGAEAPEKADQLQNYLEAKHNADTYLKESGLNYTIVRPGALTNEKPTGHIQSQEKFSKQGEISRGDVAQVLVAALHDSVAKNATFEILSGRELIGKALEAY